MYCASSARATAFSKLPIRQLIHRYLLIDGRHFSKLPIRQLIGRFDSYIGKDVSKLPIRQLMQQR